MLAQAGLVESDAGGEKPVEVAQRLWSILANNYLPPPQGRGSGADAAPRPAADRIRLSLPGRCLMQNGSEFPCLLSDISPIGLGIRGLRGGRPGEWVIAHVRALGVLDGVIVQSDAVGFVIGVRATPSRLDRLSSRIGWHIRRQSDNVPERRAHERVEPVRRRSILKCDEREPLPCEILDVSAGGAAVNIGQDALYYWVGQTVRLGKRRAEVIRHFPNGIVVRFDESFEEEVPLDVDG